MTSKLCTPVGHGDLHNWSSVEVKEILTKNLSSGSNLTANLNKKKSTNEFLHRL